jgi:hypothetical protein
VKKFTFTGASVWPALEQRWCERWCKIDWQISQVLLLGVCAVPDMVGSCGGGGDEYMADRKDLEIYKVTRVQERV